MQAKHFHLARTHVVRPHDAMLLGIGLDVALEVDVVALLDVVRTQRGAQRQGDLRRIWKGVKKPHVNNSWSGILIACANVQISPLCALFITMLGAGSY